ncbi:sigma-54-dependent transcriptional regulator [Desulfovibrio inopinatus]|uniref:sigma-54-dependent transcriptional regulator n=1 Tax=Desulfovibrio inopinatus TaxID=102109 RepID=UPI00042070C6|nr:sigma-54 dependent transcriptional regulator [Desulfovibrio inopinatus]
MTEKSILFVSPAHSVTSLFPSFKEAGLEAGIAENVAGALAFVKKSHPVIVFTQARIGAYSAKQLLEEAEADPTFPPIVVFSERGSATEAQQFLALGAKDYWLAPLTWEKIKAVIPLFPNSEAPVPEEPVVKPTTVKATTSPGHVAIIGSHPAIRRVLQLARQVAKSKATVLISGESGTGKEMFAKYLHAHSDRLGKPFIALNCAALPEHLLESELFGHERGAFTGAIARKLGKFELAHTGTILLDEISEMDLGLQAKLLRVLQEGEFDRVGGVETVKVDVRVLATTNRFLDQYVGEGKFRQDLFYRLNVIPLKLPPLRDRGEDIVHLAAYFVNNYCETYEINTLEFSDEARSWLMEYDWPGNVRELQNLMERAVLLAGTGPIQKAHFLLDSDSWPEFEEDEPESSEDTADRLHRDAETSQNAENAEGDNGESPSDDSAQNSPILDVLPLEVMERHMILRGLKQTAGNRTQAAQLLGISVRTLRNKLSEYRKLGVDIP